MSEETTWLFAYGTIQPGHGNFIDGLCAGEYFPGTVRGRLYWVGPPGSYPVADLVPLDEPAPDEHVVYGTWIEVDPHSRAFRDIARMEIGAGYSVISVEDTKSGLIGNAFNFKFQWKSRDAYIEIEDGDWNRAISRLDKMTNSW